jgi:hypothetical protein
MTAFLKAHQATLVIENEEGDVVLRIGRAEFAMLWGEPESGPSGFDDAACAGPTGRGALWTSVLEGGLPEGTYTISLGDSLRHPVTDGFHTCWFDDGTRVASPPAFVPRTVRSGQHARRRGLALGSGCAPGAAGRSNARGPANWPASRFASGAGIL